MALTVEEKLEKLTDYEGWLGFTDAQREFLRGIATGSTPSESFLKAYPETKVASTVFAAQQMLSRASIKKALDSIGIDLRKPVVSRSEAQEILSRHLRNRDLDPELMLKTLGVYIKLSGWDKEKPAPGDEEVPMDKLVAAVEKKRKEK